MCASLLILTVALSSCWKEEYAELPANIAAFTPDAGEAVRGWIVEPISIPGLLCPDGETARFHMVYPKSAVDGAPMPAAVVYPTGSFDFVFAPDPSTPFEGAHLADPSRLTSDWAIRHTFTTLGMYPEQDGVESQGGALPLALSEAGIAMLIPGNCWGDLWHNAPGLADSAYEQDYFLRNGRTAADWGYRLLADPTFGPFFGIELPISIDTTQTYAVGLGSGGRAVAEMLSLSNNDGTPTFAPVGVLLDSSMDDVRFFYADPTLYGNTVAGLDRIHPDGVIQTASGSLHTSANWPGRVGYLFSDAHPTLPQQTFAATAARIQQGTAAGETGAHWLYIDDAPATTVMNGSDQLDLARQAVQFLTTGVQPPAGPGEIPTID